MKIKIYQVDMKQDETNLAFRDYREFERQRDAGRLSPNVYQAVFEGEVLGNHLEDVFEIFNLRHPEGYTGRSLSISDLVQVLPDSSPIPPGFYYCDRTGFQRIEQEIELSYQDLKAMLRKTEREHRSHTLGYLVFTKDTFLTPYSELERTYAISGDNKAFISGMGGYSIFGSSLDGGDPHVRLDEYMKDERGGPDGWRLERCYIRKDPRELIELFDRGTKWVKSEASLEEQEKNEKAGEER